MTFSDLKTHCPQYSKSGKSFDQSLHRFRTEVGPARDLTNLAHIWSMLRWLNCWDCRQFAKQYHSSAAKSIFDWYKCNQSRIPAANSRLIDVSDVVLQETAHAYALMRDAYASDKKGKSGERHRVTCGPTGAAKILYALRPDALPPWDNSIRKRFRYDGSEISYLEYLWQVRGIIGDVIEQAKREGVDPDRIPSAVGRAESSLPKLVDEYHWVTITRGGTDR